MVVRASAVARRTSGFVDVTTTGPVAASTFGTTSADVFPERDGPSTSTERSGPVHAQPRAPRPRYMPPLPARAASWTRANESAQPSASR
jgi:hypothetical protein